MEYLLTGFSPAVDAFAFTNTNWSIDEDEAEAILDVVKKASLASLGMRLPLVDGLLDGLLAAAPFLAIPQVQDLLVKYLANYTKLDAARPAFCCGMCFCALDAYSARQPSTRGVPGRQPTRHGTPQEVAVRKTLLQRHLDAWKQGAAWISIETKLVQRTRGVEAIRRRSARDLARLITALRNDTPTPILIHQAGDDPFSSHCLVAYGAVINPQAGDAQVVELYVYDPNRPLVRTGDAPTSSAGWTSERRLKVIVVGGLAHPTALRVVELSDSDWELVGLSVTPYLPATPSPSLIESGATVTRSGVNATVGFRLANAGTGELGPFVVGGRSTVITPASGSRETWPETTVREPRAGGGIRTTDGPTTTYDTVVVRVPPTHVVTDRSPNPPQVVAPGTTATAEVTFPVGGDVARLVAVLGFVWRSRVAELAAAWRAQRGAGRGPLGAEVRTYERRPAGSGVIVRP